MIFGCFLSLAVSANSLVVDLIEIKGNEKTRPDIILREIGFAHGDTVTDEVFEQSTQAIKDLGLFEEVRIDKTINTNGTADVLIVVKEKRYNFILPKLDRNGDGDVTTGIVWRSDNLFGKNQLSKLTLAYREFSGADEEREKRINWVYSYPRISNSPYSLYFSIAHEETILDETVNFQTGRYEREKDYLRLLVGRRFKETGPSQGLSASIGPQWERFDHDFRSGTSGLLPDVTVQAMVARIDGYYVHDHLLSRSGYHYGYEFLWSSETIGSDVAHIQHYGFFRKYIPLPDVEHSNLNFQLVFGYSSRSVLGPPQYKIGGSKSLRGYDRDEVEGNSYAVFNLEWLRPLAGRETLRSAVTMDVGNAWENSDDITLSNLRYSAGLGLRWKIKRFVKTDVRLDIAQGLSDGGKTKVYLGSKSTF